MNVDEEAASMTNTPTNLSPQSSTLNQNNWKYLEMDIRVKASSMEGKDGVNDLELLTGPLYELPPAMLQNENGKLRWQQLLETGGETNKKQPWCNEKAGSAFRSSVLVNKKGKQRTEMTECLVNGAEDMQRASDDPNRLKISYRKSAKSFPLRAPLGYFKLMVMESGSHHGRRTCAFIMDQVGQCLLVSVELLIRLAHLDVSGTEWARDGGLESRNSSDGGRYNAAVNPYWCVPPGSTMRSKHSCLFKTRDVQDPEGITTEIMDEYWSRQINATTLKKRQTKLE